MKRSVYDTPLQSPLAKALIGLGSFLSRLIPGRNHSGIFFFFPYWHVGGAERVHADIVRCVWELKPWVFFTHRSQDSKFRKMFQGGARLFNVWALLKYTLPFSVGLLSGYINRHDRAVVFGCSSRFFYKMLPFLSAEVKKIDLLHAFGGGAEDFSLEAVPCLDRRVAINRRTVADFASQYLSSGVPSHYLERVVVIENSVPVPAAYPKKERGGSLKVLYVGRGTEEKRVHLVGAAAALCAAQGIAAEFILVGDVEQAVAVADRKWCRFTGELSDPGEMAALYAAADLLVLTSSREGFPMVIMEAMAHGVVPVSTAVGGIPEHVVHARNGFLLAQDEPALPREIADLVRELSRQPETLDATSRNAYRYARDHFSCELFCRKYRELLGCL